MPTPMNVPSLNNRLCTRLSYALFILFVVVLFCVFSRAASAYETTVGDLLFSADTSVSIGAGWRLAERDKRQLGLANLGVPLGGNRGASSPNNDDGNWNFEKGKTFSKLLKAYTEMTLSGTNAGVVVSASYYYDWELMKERRAADAQGFRRELSDETLDDAGHDFNLLNAYFYVNLPWRQPISYKLGRQTINWGEGLFIQGGISAINRFDVAAARQPGAQLKEIILPSEFLNLHVALTDQLSLEGFYQLEWEATELDGCGTYFSINDAVGNGCGPILLQNIADSDAGSIVPSPLTVLPRVSDRTPRNDGQYGLALRGFADVGSGLEWGLFYLKYHSRTPYFSGFVANPFQLAPTEDLPIVGGASYYSEYPEDLRVWAATLSGSTDSGWTWAGEYSWYENQPVQWNATDVISGGGLRLYSRHLMQRMEEAGASSPIELAGSALKGYDRFKVSQLQVSTIKAINVGAEDGQVYLLAEAGAVYIHDFPSLNQARYGRADAFGLGDFAGLPSSVYPDLNPLSPLNPNAYSCDGVGAVVAVNANPSYCDAEGYTSQFAWGYVAALWMDFSTAIHGLRLQPKVNISHDVKGYSPAPLSLFVEGRKSLGLSLTADYLLSQYSASINYVNYFDGGRDNVYNDRDYISAAVSFSF